MTQKDEGPGRKEYEGDRSADRAERLEKAAHLTEKDVGPTRQEYEGDRSADRAERVGIAEVLAEEGRERRKDPGPTGTEFKAFRDEDRLRRGLSIAVVLGVLLLAGFQVLNAVNDADRDDAITVCEDNREGFQHLYDKELEGLNDPVLRDAFPHFSKQEFDKLIDKESKEIQAEKADLNPGECKELFD